MFVMEIDTCAALAALNREFYASFAEDFDRTRAGWPLGFSRILPHLAPAANVLDLGCGNGRLLAFLMAQGWQGRYVGLDSSGRLLAAAQERLDQRGWSAMPADGMAGERSVPQADFIEADLLTPGWTRQIAGFAPDAIACLAVLHHIPGRAHRVRFLAQCAALLSAGAVLVVSTWQFMGSPRLRARVLPWKAAGLDEADLEPGDYLLSWGAGAAGKRYCAYIEREELHALADEAGLTPAAIFVADGHEGDLNLYGVFTSR